MKEYIVTKENFATALNLGYVTKASLDRFNSAIDNYQKQISEMVIRQNQQEEVIKEAETAAEVAGIGTDAAKVLVNKTINEGLTQIHDRISQAHFPLMASCPHQNN